MNTIIGILVCISAIRTFSFGIWCLKNKNIIGGISVFFLGIISVLFSTLFL